MKEDVNRAIEVSAIELFSGHIKNGILIAAKNAMLGVDKMEKFTA
jgi:hypothetical protein